MNKQTKAILTGQAGTDNAFAADLVLSFHEIEEAMKRFETPRVFLYTLNGELVVA